MLRQPVEISSLLKERIEPVSIFCLNPINIELQSEYR
jgi:hypothetical protein